MTGMLYIIVLKMKITLLVVALVLVCRAVGLAGMYARTRAQATGAVARYGGRAYAVGCRGI